MITGKDLKKWRKTAKLSRQYVADQCIVSPRTVEAWEQERTPIPDKNLPRLESLTNGESVLEIRVTSQTLEKAIARAKEKNYESPEALLKDFLEKFLVVLILGFAHVAQRLDLQASQNKMQISENNCCAVK